ncbi:hypothetical protein [Emticicia sp. SJ17W-69]|uniref:hypothetical protein n=1 Tax=Emticicia sp. SJ17W-69 TaxID=3421657 RepID=UPI003EBD623B
MIFSKNVYLRAIFCSLFIVVLLFACGKNEIKLLKDQEVIVKEKLCYLKSANQGHGIIYNFSYDVKNQLTQIEGFPDFDFITYENGLPKKATNSLDKSYYVGFDYDAKGALSQISFVGKDSRGKAFEFKSKVYTNTKKQIEKIDLLLPVFDEVVVTKIEYDAIGNTKKISLIEGTKTRTVLENLTFDDKKSPYLNTPFANVMAYFIIFSSTIGAENTTYFSNRNNVTSAKIYSDNGDILYNYKHEYNPEGYVIKTKVTRKGDGQEQNYEETYVYDCK